MDLSTQQKTTLKAALVADASTATARSRRDLHALTNWLNAKTVDADVDVPIERIRRALLSQEILGAIRARVDYYRAKLAGASAPGGADEVKLGKLHTALAAVEMLPSFGVSTKATKDFVTALLTNLVTEGVMTSQQATGLLALAPGKVSPLENVVGAGAVASFEDTIAILGA